MNFIGAVIVCLCALAILAAGYAMGHTNRAIDTAVSTALDTDDWLELARALGVVDESTPIADAEVADGEGFAADVEAWLRGVS